jgi:AcrR family transcriptional regulator
MPRKVTSPDALLDGAMALVQRAGIASITIEAVATESGVSKGAVLHHFPTKSALMLALVARFAGRIQAGVEARLAVDREPGALIRALLDLSVPGTGADASTDVERTIQAVLASSVHDPALLAPIREVGVGLRDQMLADRQRGLADLILILARDGLLLWQMCGFLERDDALSRRVMRELRRRAATTPGDTP